MATLSQSRILRANELSKKLGVSRVTLWRWQRAGLLPPRVQYGPNSVGWVESEIDAWWNAKSGNPPSAEAS